MAPLAIGLLPVFPLAALLCVYGRAQPGAELWTTALAVAFAICTLLRNTPGGRRRLDDLVLAARQLRVRIGRERIADLVAPVVRFFEDRIRILAEWLHRIQMQLSLRLNDPTYAAVLKAMMAQLWSFFDAIVRFYAVVLIEPQTNQVKHFRSSPCRTS